MNAWITALGLLLSITSAGRVAAESPVQVDRLTAMAVSLDVVHTVGTDAGGIPDSLKKYGKYLRRAGSENWKLTSRKTQRLNPGAEKLVTLPGKLGKARISLDAKGVATVKIVDMKGKSLGTYRSSRFPLVIANNRLRIGGKPYVFILDRPTKK